MIIFDQKKYAEDVINNGYSSKRHINRDNIILVKYWKYMGLNKSEIESNLRKFMSRYKYLYNRNILDSRIRRAMNIGMRYELVTGVTVEILDNEIELINQLDTTQQRRLMFVLLVIWKFWGMEDFRASNKDIIGLTKTKMRNDVFWNNIHQITKKGLLCKRKYREKDYYVVNMKQVGKPIITINNYKNLIYHYLALDEPEKYGYCEECGAIIKITSNRKIYCRACWREVRRKYQKNIMSEIRKKQLC